LNAFMSASANVDTDAQKRVGVESTAAVHYGIADFEDPYAGQSSSQAKIIDAEQELLAALNSIEASVTRFTLAPGTVSAIRPGQANARSGFAANVPSVPEGANASSAMVKAAKKMCEATAALMASAAEAQKDIKKFDGATYRNDPNWTSGVVSSAKAVAETTGLLVDVACNPNSTPEDIIAAVRCVNGATARLVAFTRVKGDPNSPAQQNLEQASRTIARAANNLVEIAKRQKQAQTDSETDRELATISSAPKTRQIKLEFEAQARIAKLEQDLDAARQYLFKLRRAVYGGTPVDSPAPTPKMGGNAPKKTPGFKRGGGNISPARGAPSGRSPNVPPRNAGGAKPMPRGGGAPGPRGGRGGPPGGRGGPPRGGRGGAPRAPPR